MSTTNANAEERTDLDPRTERALTEYLTVLPDEGRAHGADDIFTVVSQSGETYLVDTRLEACECPDHEYREARCKHLRRVAFATGAEPIPAAAAAVLDVDDFLGRHCGEGEPQVAATDGGVVTADDPVTVTDDEDTDDDRRAIARAVLSTDVLSRTQRRNVDGVDDTAELATLPFPTFETARAAREAVGVVRLGEDVEGGTHVLDTRHDSAEIRVHEGTDITQRYDLLETDRTLADWIQYVAHARGWAHLAAGLTVPAEGER